VLEQRKLERFDLSIPATIRVVAKDREREKEPINLLTKNICEGGAFFHTSHPLPQGKEVRVDLILPLNGLKLKKIKEDRSRILVKGVVSRSEIDGMAISFQKGYKIRSLRSLLIS
jgi:hypothetical protein